MKVSPGLNQSCQSGQFFKFRPDLIRQKNIRTGPLARPGQNCRPGMIK